MTDKPIAEKSATFERPLGSDPRDPAETRGDAREVASGVSPKFLAGGVG